MYVPALSIARLPKLAIPFTGRTTVVPLNEAPVELDATLIVMVPVNELSVPPTESRTTNSADVGQVITPPVEVVVREEPQDRRAVAAVAAIAAVDADEAGAFTAETAADQYREQGSADGQGCDSHESLTQ